MIELNCPSCGSSVTFELASSVLAVCGHCQSVLVRQDLDLKLLGKHSEVITDLSPIQIGSEGKYEKESFRVLGRTQVGWTDGYWNEWYLLFESQKTGWLTDAQGFYGMSFESSFGKKIPDRAQFVPGFAFKLGPVSFQVDDCRQARVVSVEGELPRGIVLGEEFWSVDAVGHAKEFASIQYFNEEPTLYLGRYLEWPDLRMTSLKTLYGW